RRKSILARRTPKHRTAGVADVGGAGSADLLDMWTLRRGPGIESRVRTSHLGRLLAVSSLTMLLPFGTPPAQAVSPPGVDDRWLPKPALPAPPRPTVQREVCATLAVDSGPGPSQPPRAVDLSEVWALTRGAGQRVAVIDTGISRHRRLPDV